jgi:hypothetical protein
MVERIAAADAFNDEPGSLVQTGAKVRLPVAINSAISLG